MRDPVVADPPHLQRHLPAVEVVERPHHLALAAPPDDAERLVPLAEELGAHPGSAVRAQVAQLDRAAGDRRVRELDAPAFAVRADVELPVQARQVLLDRGLGDDELRGDRPDRRRLGERIAGQQRAAQGEEHVALALRERRRLGDRGRLLPARRAVEQQAEPSEQDLVAGVQRVARR